MIKNKVHIQKCNNLRSHLREALEAIGWQDIVHEGDKVVIKVNLCDTKYKEGVITNPQLVYEVIKLLQSKGCKVTVVESDNLFFLTEKACKATGIYQVIEKAGARFVDLTEDEKVIVHPDDTLFTKEYLMAKTLKEADVFITMPVLKTHDVTLYSGALKNQMGCYPQRNRVLLHPHIDEVLCDINTILKPNIVIMDALIALEGNGPTRGYPVKMDLIITSNNPISCDLVGLKIIGFDVDEIGHVALAAKMDRSAQDYLLTGESVEAVKRDFKKPYDDIVNKGQKFLFKHRLLTNILLTSPIGLPIFKVARTFRWFLLRGKTEYW